MVNGKRSMEERSRLFTVYHLPLTIYCYTLATLFRNLKLDGRHARTMRVIKILSIAFSVALAVMACGGGANNNQTVNTTNGTGNTANTNAKAEASPADPLTSARATYASECARCHGINGDGGTVTVMKKKLKVPSLKMGHALGHSDEQLAKQIREGGDGMPAFKDQLKPEEITNLVQLIKEFQKGAKK